MGGDIESDKIEIPATILYDKLIPLSRKMLDLNPEENSLSNADHRDNLSIRAKKAGAIQEVLIEMDFYKQQDTEQNNKTFNVDDVLTRLNTLLQNSSINKRRGVVGFFNQHFSLPIPKTWWNDTADTIQMIIEQLQDFKAAQITKRQATKGTRVRPRVELTSVV